MSTNHLANETSPYLQQHANNPVDWYPWSQEAINKALTENKPVLLSIGYTACHWCHVMAHESFEDQATAELMNKLYVNVKVDREERPDLDKIYQTSHFILAERNGGWPLTVFISPKDLTPFFTGTYFPNEARHQLPAFKDVLQKISQIYHEHQDKIQVQSKHLKDIFQDKPDQIYTGELSLEPIERADEILHERYDALHGGFGGAPKFPNPTILEFLLRQKSPMADNSFLHMAEGGIFDQLRGGFFRYCVDNAWEIPHFEKMLYDNGQLIYLYSLAAQVYDDPYFSDIARETADWAISEMQSPEGGYYASLDADSEGHEGKFYVWNKDELKNLLSVEEFSIVGEYYGIDEAPNFENNYHLQIFHALSSTDDKHQLVIAKQKMLAARDKRPRPFRDEKILTSWNGLMIKGMLTASFVLRESRFMEAANKALAFIKNHTWKDGRLLASYKDGKAHLSAYLDDYAFLIDALITSLKISWNTENLNFALALTDTVLDHFYDEDNGGFYFTANDHETLLYRPKTFMDEATPAGNAVMVRNLQTLGYLLGETRYLHAAEKTLKLAWPVVSQHPIEHSTLLMGLKSQLQPEPMIIIRGNEAQDWMREGYGNQFANRNIFAIPDEDTNLPKAILEKKLLGATTAYVCHGTKCLAPVDSLVELIKAMM